jgi:phage terminase large subunit GpA-like protein
MKTEFLLNVAGHSIHLDPAPILMVFPKDDVAKKFSNGRLKQMVKATSVLRPLISEKSRRDSSDTIQYKEYPGGHIMMVGANAPSNLAMFPIRLVLSDEIDKYELSSGDEGDPIDLAEERTSTYSTNSLCIRCCSPTVKDMSRIEDSYNSSDRRKPFVPCPECGDYQLLMFGNVKWDRDEEGRHKPETAQYCCACCGVLWTERQRLEALSKVQWRQTADFACSDCGHHNKPSQWDPNKDIHNWKEKHHVMRAACEACGVGLCPNEHAGFWANKIYSPFRDLTDLVKKFLRAKQSGNVEKLKAFINTQLAETFEESGERIEDLDFLMQRREQFGAEMPDGVGIITAGVDVQNNRFEIEVVGWGLDEESWSIDYHVIPGDLATPEPWTELWDYLNKPFFRTDGRLSYISAAAIDMQGSHTQQVMNFCRTTIQRRFWPIRGMGGEGRPIPVWPKNPGKYRKGQIPFYNIGVDAGKNIVFTRLLLPDPGPGFCHFPTTRDAEYFKQLTVEKRVKKYRRGNAYYQWQNVKKERNEAFDCRVYAYAALCGLQSAGWQVNIITREERLIVGPEYEEKRQRQLGRLPQAPKMPKAQPTPPDQQKAQPKTVTKRPGGNRSSTSRSKFMSS